MQDQLWSSILSNDEIMESYLEKAQSRASEAMDYTLNWLEKWNIKHSNPVSGHVFWIDLRPYLPKRDKDSRAHSDPWKQESDLFQRFLNDHNIYVAPGASYHPPAAGFFRLTFAMRRPFLEEGMRRIELALKEVQKRNEQEA